MRSHTIPHIVMRFLKILIFLVSLIHHAPMIKIRPTNCGVQLDVSCSQTPEEEHPDSKQKQSNVDKNKTASSILSSVQKHFVCLFPCSFCHTIDTKHEVFSHYTYMSDTAQTKVACRTQFNFFETRLVKQEKKHSQKVVSFCHGL